MNDEHEFLVRLEGPRPDFRTVISFLWSDFHNVDSEGNSHNPASREWTDLYLQNRENEDEIVDVMEMEKAPLILRIASPIRLIALGVAYFLVHWSSGDILDPKTKRSINQQIVMDDLESNFDLLVRIERAERSIWNSSTLDNPYPNLKKSG